MIINFVETLILMYIYLPRNKHIHVHLKFICSSEGQFRFSVFQALPGIDCFTDCMGVHFSTAELDNAIWFSNLSQNSNGVKVSVA